MNESQEGFWAAIFSENGFAGEARTSVVQGGVLLEEECKIVSKTKNETLTNSTYGKTLNEYVLLFKGRDIPTMPHEVLHALSLQHTFVSRDGVEAAPQALYTYQAESTENVMDYTKKGISTWLWQWKILWKKLGVEIQDTPEKSLDSIPLNF